MLLDLLTQTAAISRQQAASTGITKTYQDTGGIYKTLIQPLSPRATQEWGIAMGNGYLARFQSDADIQVSDRIVDDAGLEYRVVGLNARRYGMQPHLTAYLQLEPGK